MRAEDVCGRVRPEISAKLDGELDPEMLELVESHLENCAECRAYEADLRAVRRAVRVQAVRAVPDLTDSIMERVRAGGPPSIRRDQLRAQIRTAMVAAAAAAVLLFGVTSPFFDHEPVDVAAASQIVRNVKDAARALSSFRASYSIVERNWHPAVPVRRFTADVWFRAPERFRLQLRDLTTYPDPHRWPRNDVDLVAGPRALWIEEPFSCPVEALPDCAVAAGSEQRSIVNRAPFDGSATLPTDIVVPVETISGAGDLDVIGDERIAGRRAHRIELTYRQAVPLIRALQPGGSWRPFYPQDKVELWIDTATSVPLRVRIIASSLRERSRWAEINFVHDEPGQVLLSVEAKSFNTAPASSTSFVVPASSAGTDSGFSPRPFAAVAGRAPSYTAGLHPYRAGTAGRTKILSYADGLVWLKASYDRGGSRAAADPSVAEQVRVGNGYGYYRPADDSLRRSLDVFGRGVHVRIESNLGRDQLVDVAASLPVRGHRVGFTGPGTRIGPGELGDRPWVLRPSFLPLGYDIDRPSAAQLFKEHGRKTVVAYYRAPEAEYDGFGIQITQWTGGLLPPSSDTFLQVRVDGVWGRWSPERGELEWVDGGVYRAVRAPSLDLATVVSIARGLE